MTSPESSKRCRCVVIGSGLAGLAAADVMVNAGWQTTLIDAAGRAGGVIETIREDGWLIERSADSFLTTRPEALETAVQLGLEDQILPLQATARRALVLGRGKLHAVPAGFRLMVPGQLTSLLRSPLLSPLGKLRVACERFVPASKASDESLEAFAVRRLGREAFERLVQPLCSGIWTANPAKLSMAAALPDFLAMEKQFGSLRAGEKKRLVTADRREAAAGARYGHFVTLATGLDTLATRWITSLRARGVSTLQSRVLEIERRDGFRVELSPSPATHAAPDPDFAQPLTQTLEAEAVIITAPAPRAAGIVRPLSPALAAELASIEYAGSAIVSLGYPREAISHPLDAAGLVIPRQERRQILAVSFSSSKFAHRAPAGHVLMRVFLGGALDPAAASFDDDTLVQRATQEVGQLLGAHGRPSLVRVARWEGAMPQYHLGHVERFSRIKQLVAEVPGCGIAGAALEGVGIPQVIASGRAAAEQAMTTSSSCRPSREPRLPSSSSSS